MFDVLGSLTTVDDCALIDAITAGARTEAQAACARLSAIGELTIRRVDEHDGRQLWACDGWDDAAAQIGAALMIGRREAGAQMHIGVALHTRLPKVAAVFATGAISAKVVSMISWRTRLVNDTDVAALLDTALAGSMRDWGPLSEKKLKAAIDGWVHKFDPAAVISTRAAARARTIAFGKPDDDTEVVSLWGALLATDAALLDQALNALSRTVCPADPRTLGQRRSDALGVLAVRGDHLTCQCGHPGCTAAGVDARAAAVIIHVLTDTTPQPVPDPQLNTPTPLTPVPPVTPTPPTPAPPVNTPQPTPEPAPATQPATRPAASLGYLPGGQVIPPNLLADLVARGATIRPLSATNALGAMDRYRPSKALDEFVRLRAMTCTFPGCDAPAMRCDVDHVIPWPGGPTHGCNLGPKCRKHHLLKTFWTGPGGWSDRQEPDGTTIWTAPTGHTYRSVALTRILFPDKDLSTPPPAPPDPKTEPETQAPQPGRGIMMPTRRRTRTQDRTARITYERTLNEKHLTNTEKPDIPRPQPATRRTWDDILGRHHPPDPNNPPPF
jgi:hypothetical protein